MTLAKPKQRNDTPCMSLMVGLTWRPECGHRGEQQITDAVTVHTCTTPATKQREKDNNVFINI